MKPPLPTRIDLDQDEENLHRKIRSGDAFHSLSPEEVALSCQSASALFRRLWKRGVIPEARWKWFVDPELIIGSKRSRMQWLQKNSGKAGLGIIEIPAFAHYLGYFIAGPNLPTDVIYQFWKRVVSEEYVSGSDLSDLRAIARDSVRLKGLDLRDAGEEFYKLSIECGLNNDYARFIRDAVRAIR
ncbi:MAG: hypothetical protein PHQ40_05605 [Anaerolineaceae bacterium]|nr:hypothetical protein [Anaerolineaceae bacterium]